VEVAWEINVTDEFGDWFDSLSIPEDDSVRAVVDRLIEFGPSLDRPHVDKIVGSQYHNMKELRPRGPGKNIRVLFCFDPRRQAILLIGGDKQGQWSGWYSGAIKDADRLYGQYLIDLEVEGLLD